MDNLIMDEVIKRRLLIDGDGCGDDRRLTALTKSFISWCKNTDETKAETNVSHKRLVGQLKHVEHTARRTHHNVVSNERAKTMYNCLGKEVKKEINATRSEITEAKSLLGEATKHRKQSLEFDALAKLIECKPDRTESEQRVEELKEDIEVFEKRRDLLNSRLEARKKQMFIIATAVDQVEEVLKEHDEFEMIERIETNGLLPKIPEISAPVVEEPVPMEVDSTEQPTNPSSPNGSGGSGSGSRSRSDESPTQQSPEESPDESTSVITGTVTSVPITLSLDEKGLVEKSTIERTSGEKRGEKYDDLSEGSDAEERA